MAALEVTLTIDGGSLSKSDLKYFASNIRAEEDFDNYNSYNVWFDVDEADDSIEDLGRIDVVSVEVV